MRPPTTSEEAGILFITFDDPSGLNDGMSDAYRQAIYDLVQARSNPKIAADMSPIDYLSSSGVALLVGLKRRVDAQQGSLVLCQLHPYVQDVLKVTKLKGFFTIVPDRPAALEQLGGMPA